MTWQVLVTMVFTPSVWKGLQLDLEFSSGTLTLMVDMGVSGQVLWQRLPVRPQAIRSVHAQLVNPPIRVGI